MKRILLLLFLSPCFVGCYLFDNEDTYKPLEGYFVGLEMRNYTDSTLVVTCNFPGPDENKIESGLYRYEFFKHNGGNPPPSGLSETPLFMARISWEGPVSSFEEFVDSLSIRFPNPNLHIKIRYDIGSYTEFEEIGTVQLADCIVGYQDDYLQPTLNNPWRRVDYHVTRFILFASDIIPLCQKSSDEKSQ